MKIGLIDVDGHNYPNLALMKLSAWHKAHGDSVEWAQGLFGDYDRVYKSKVFTFTPDDETAYDCEIVKGGTGYFYPDGGQPLPYEVEHTYPDYSLYPEYTENTAYGFLTRGCPRGCDFCIVGHKEGRTSRKVADLSEFWSGQKNIVLQDPNILACKDWEELLQQCIDSRARIDFNQGLDIRLMTPEKAAMIHQCKIKTIHFALDRYEDKDWILPKFAEFAKTKKQSQHNAVVYTLVNYGETFEQALERIYILRDMDYWPFVMIYDKASLPPRHPYKKLARWVNNRFVFGACQRFEDYIDK